jgi:hypothetical protein
MNIWSLGIGQTPKKPDGNKQFTTLRIIGRRKQLGGIKHGEQKYIQRKEGLSKARALSLPIQQAEKGS